MLCCARRFPYPSSNIRNTSVPKRVVCREILKLLLLSVVFAVLACEDTSMPTEPTGGEIAADVIEGRWAGTSTHVTADGGLPGCSFWETHCPPADGRYCWDQHFVNNPQSGDFAAMFEIVQGSSGGRTRNTLKADLSFNHLGSFNSIDGTASCETRVRSVGLHSSSLSEMGVLSVETSCNPGTALAARSRSGAYFEITCRKPLADFYNHEDEPGRVFLVERFYPRALDIRGQVDGQRISGQLTATFERFCGPGTTEVRAECVYLSGDPIRDRYIGLLTVQGEFALEKQ